MISRKLNYWLKGSVSFFIKKLALWSETIRHFDWGRKVDSEDLNFFVFFCKFDRKTESFLQLWLENWKSDRQTDKQTIFRSSDQNCKKFRSFEKEDFEVSFFWKRELWSLYLLKFGPSIISSHFNQNSFFPRNLFSYISFYTDGGDGNLFWKEEYFNFKSDQI